MPSDKYILVRVDFEDKILQKLQELEALCSSLKNQSIVHDGIQWFDNADLMGYLKISRRTTLTLRQKGLPCSQVDGKLLYRKDLIDNFLTDHQIKLPIKNTNNGN